MSVQIWPALLLRLVCREILSSYFKRLSFLCSSFLAPCAGDTIGGTILSTRTDELPPPLPVCLYQAPHEKKAVERFHDSGFDQTMAGALAQLCIVYNKI